MTSRLFLLLGPLLLLVSCSAAIAQDGSAATALLPASGITLGGGPMVDYLLGLGPIGALVWGAYLLGKGVTITLTHKIEMGDEDRKLFREFTEQMAERDARPAPRRTG